MRFWLNLNSYRGLCVSGFGGFRESSVFSAINLVDFGRVAFSMQLGPDGHAKVPAEVPEDSRVLRARRSCTQLLIASTPGSSSLERPGLDNITSQPWSDATCPCTTS